LVDGEAARISKLGTELGIANPVVDNAPRFEHGTCVFLSEDNQCTLHRHFGPEAKPHRCQDFPLKRIGVENQLRVGVDPSCSTSWQTWKTGPIIGPEQLEGLITTPVPWSEPDIRMESPLLRILGGSIAAALYGLSGQRQQGRGLPQGFNQRIIETMQSIRLRQFLDHHEIGHKMRAPMNHLPEFIDHLDPKRPPAWPVLSPEMDAFAVRMTQRMVFLRYGPLRPAALGVTLLSLAGAVLCAWADPRPQVFGPAMSGWTRVIRFQAMWLRLAPSPAHLEWLATGRTP